MKITFLGTGTSFGVPTLLCKCKVCTSTDPRDKRLRSSIIVEHKNKSILIDAGPDFRTQMLNNNIQKIDAVLITHSHKDHLGGLDDVRPYNYYQGKDMPIFANEFCISRIKHDYDYCFDTNPYPGIPKLVPIAVEDKDFYFEDIKITPINVWHYKLKILGFRIDNFAYITDASFIHEEELYKLKDLDTLVLNALHIERHNAHFNLEQALAMVKKLKPKKAYFTHMSHHMGLYSEVKLPNNICLAYDGLVIEV